jgi:hypothetical protein
MRDGTSDKAWIDALTFLVGVCCGLSLILEIAGLPREISWSSSEEVCISTSE